MNAKKKRIILAEINIIFFALLLGNFFFPKGVKAVSDSQNWTFIETGSWTVRGPSGIGEYGIADSDKPYGSAVVYNNEIWLIGEVGGWRGAFYSASIPPISPACVPDGCNGVCPYGCTVNDDPDCGCKNGDGCCGIGCNHVNDNECLLCSDTCTCVCPNECPSPGGECRSGLVPCGRSCDDPCTEICESCPCTLCHLFVLFKRIVDFLVKDILLPLVVLMIVIGGVMFLTAAGDPDKIRTAKKILTPASSPLQHWSQITC